MLTIYRSLFLMLVFFCFYAASNAQVATYSNEFLNIGVDAASLSRGNAVTATSKDVSAGYWNPAGLTRLNQRSEVGLMHANYFSGLAQYDFLGFAHKTSDSLALGLSIIRFGVDNIPNTLDLVDADGNVNYDRITYFSVADYAMLVSLGKKSVIPGLDWGVNVKLIYRQQGDFARAYGFGFDLGGQYSLKKWRFGLMLRDVTSTFNLWSFNEDLFEETFLATGNEIPKNSLELTLPKLLLGFSRSFDLNEKLKLQTELDVDVHFDGEHNSVYKAKPLSFDPHFGFEFSYLKNVFLRAGIDRLQLIEDFDTDNKFIFQPSIGIGFSLLNFSLDYALTDVGDMTVAPVSHVFSLKYSFGK